jgi:hypothetical protein
VIAYQATSPSTDLNDLGADDDEQHQQLVAILEGLASCTQLERDKTERGSDDAGAHDDSELQSPPLGFDEESNRIMKKIMPAT